MEEKQAKCREVKSGPSAKTEDLCMMIVIARRRKGGEGSLKKRVVSAKQNDIIFHHPDIH